MEGGSAGRFPLDLACDEGEVLLKTHFEGLLSTIDTYLATCYELTKKHSRRRHPAWTQR